MSKSNKTSVDAVGWTLPVWAVGVVGLGGLALVVAGFLLHPHDYFAIAENSLAYPVFGFVGFLLFVAIARAWQGLVGRNERFYGEDSVSGEDETLAGTEQYIEREREEA